MQIPRRDARRWLPERLQTALPLRARHEEITVHHLPPLQRESNLAANRYNIRADRLPVVRLRYGPGRTRGFSENQAFPASLRGGQPSSPARPV